MNNGIDIVFENAKSNSGEISCTKDECIGNNDEYVTHPLFTNKDITQRYDSTDDNKKEISYENYIDVRGNVYIKDSAGIYHKFVKLQYNPEDDTYSRIIQDIDSNYNPTTDPKPDSEFDHKQVNSNYTLWKALGEYKCYELKPNTDKLSGSEYSIQKVAEIANQTGILLKDVSPNNVYSQKDIYQFMKHSDIHYNPTEGAVKHGIVNKENIFAIFMGDRFEDIDWNLLHATVMYQ